MYPTVLYPSFWGIVGSVSKFLRNYLFYTHNPRCSKSLVFLFFALSIFLFFALFAPFVVASPYTPGSTPFTFFTLSFSFSFSFFNKKFVMCDFLI